MTFTFAAVATLALCVCTVLGESCPQEYLTITKEHSFCKPTNRSCKFVSKGSLTEKEKTEIVDVHNAYRNKVAMGRESLAGGLPTASNMLAFTWDNELAEIAQKWAEQCIFDHDCNECRATSRFPVGQNMGYGWYSCSGPCSAEPAEWSDQLKDFYDEVGDYDKSLLKSFSSNGPKKIGHFTQMIWADTHKIGCGFASFEEDDGVTQLYVCNYGPVGNIRKRPVYTEGSPCSKCPANTCCGSKCNAKYPGLCFFK